MLPKPKVISCLEQEEKPYIQGSPVFKDNPGDLLSEIKLKNDMENHQPMCLSDLEIQAPGDIVSKKASVNVHQKTTGKENHGDVHRLGKWHQDFPVKERKKLFNWWEEELLKFNDGSKFVSLQINGTRVSLLSFSQRYIILNIFLTLNPSHNSNCILQKNVLFFQGLT